MGFRVNDPMVSKATGNHGRVTRYRDGQFECEMREAYSIEGHVHDGCKFWFKESQMLRPDEARLMEGAQ